MKTLSFSTLKSLLKPRPLDSNKGDFGKVLIIGGNEGFSGAPLMAGIAAMRVGAGSVHIATHPYHANTLNGLCPELMCHSVKHPYELKERLQEADFIILGPGLGQNDWGKNLFDYLLKETNKPLLIDADGLNLLSNHVTYRDNWVLTPHPGEAARLLNTNVKNIQSDRIAAIEAIQQRFGGIIVLKGHETLVKIPNEPPSVCPFGNPGMATAGMGDVLTGVISGLAVQHIPLAQATQLGVMVHSRAGDMAAQKGIRGIMATDLFEYVRVLVQ